ncbi:MAG TPA: NAD(P)-dependent oxidoreductase, partial [Gemmatimonadaceae bacterium]|nr:NAD(P)-dependent oxidoreductase [Gemmatimonadaceae bacterium]
VDVRIVIVGATGHIGTWLVPKLVRRGHDVIAVSRGVRAPYHDFVERRDAQRVVLNRDALEHDRSFGPAIAAFGADTVIDLISFTIDSTTQIVDALRNGVGLFIHCGTLWVHGIPPWRPYDETAPRTPLGDYGIRKAEIEELLLDEASRGFPATVLHPGHITGPGWNPINPAGNLDPLVFTQLASGDKLILPNDGSATLQHVHASDVAEAFALAVDHSSAAIGESFHVAAREPVTMRSYAEQAAQWFGRDANLAFLPWDEFKTTLTDRNAELTYDHMVHSPHASIDKARRILGFEPQFTAVEAAKDAVVSAENSS